MPCSIDLKLFTMVLVSFITFCFSNRRLAKTIMEEVLLKLAMFRESSLKIKYHKLYLLSVLDFSPAA